MVEKEEEERWVQIVRQKLLLLVRKLVLVLPKLVVLLIVSLFFVVFCPWVRRIVPILRKSHPQKIINSFGAFFGHKRRKKS